jgi:hypothetical protein
MFLLFIFISSMLMLMLMMMRHCHSWRWNTIFWWIMWMWFWIWSQRHEICKCRCCWSGRLCLFGWRLRLWWRLNWIIVCIWEYLFHSNWFRRYNCWMLNCKLSSSTWIYDVLSISLISTFHFLHCTCPCCTCFSSHHKFCNFLNWFNMTSNKSIHLSFQLICFLFISIQIFKFDLHHHQPI